MSTKFNLYDDTMIHTYNSDSLDLLLPPETESEIYAERIVKAKLIILP